MAKQQRRSLAPVQKPLKSQKPTVAAAQSNALITLVQAEYVEGDPETYLLPLAFASGSRADERRSAEHHRRPRRARLADRERGEQLPHSRL